MDSRYGRSEFRDFTHAQLVAMLAAGRPVEVATAADGWRELANLLDDVALVLERQNASFSGLWEGQAADAHQAMIASLAEGVRQVAWAARRMGDQVSAAGEALRRAQERMAALGAPQRLVPPDEAVLAAASTPLPLGRARAEAATRQAAAVRAIQEYQRAQAASSTLAEAAAVVLGELRDQYLNIDFPRLPTVAEPPTIGPDGNPVYNAQRTLAGRPGSRPLFTDLWGNGLAAAAGMPPAQILQPYLPGQGPGRLGGVPQFPGPTDPALSGVDGFSRSPLDLSRDIPAGGSLPGLGSVLGGGGGGLGGLGDGVDVVAPAVGQSAMAPAIDPAAAAGRAGMGMAMVPPFLGGGFAPPMGGDTGGRAGSVASWLFGEVEEFGVRSAVVPGLVEA